MCVFMGVWLITALASTHLQPMLICVCLVLYLCATCSFSQLWLPDWCFAFGCKSRNSILCVTGVHFARVLEVFALLSMSSRLWGESRYAWSGVYGDIYIPDGHRCRPEWYDGSSVSQDATLQTGGWDLQTNRPGWIDVWMKQQGDLVNA